MIIEESRDLLERLAQALLDRETLDRAELALIAQGLELPPLQLPEPEALGAGAPVPPVRMPGEVKA